MLRSYKVTELQSNWSYRTTELRGHRATAGRPVSRLGPRQQRLLPDVIAAYFGAVSVRPAARLGGRTAPGGRWGGGGGTQHWQQRYTLHIQLNQRQMNE